jgi:four helix bundle protein
MEFVNLIYKTVNGFPSEEKYGISSQLKRAAVSISSNLAEGSSRRTNLEFARFLDISLGSAFELETQLLIVSNLHFLSEEESKKILSNLNLIQRRLNALRTSILK